MSATPSPSPTPPPRHRSHKKYKKRQTRSPSSSSASSGGRSGSRSRTRSRSQTWSPPAGPYHQQASRSIFRPAYQAQGETRLHVGNLDENVNEQDIEEAFGRFGALSEIWLASYAPFYSFIVFKHRKHAEEAVKYLNGSYLRDCKLRVTVALPRRRENGIRTSGGGYGYETRGGYEPRGRAGFRPPFQGHVPFYGHNMDFAGGSGYRGQYRGGGSGYYGGRGGYSTGTFGRRPSPVPRRSPPRRRRRSPSESSRSRSPLTPVRA